MSEAEPKRMTVDEFMAWADGQPGRHELWSGYVVAMTPGRAIHARLKHRIARRFSEQIEANALTCEAFPDGMGIRIDADTVLEPDAVVRCGMPVLGDEERFIPDPLVIVEVASPSTQDRDASEKLEFYFQLPSVQHYVIVRPLTKVLLHHERRDSGEILTHIIRDGRLVLDPPGIRIDDLFAA